MSEYLEELEATMNRGIEFMTLGDFRQALDCFLTVLDSGHMVSPALFEVRWQIKRLSVRYKPTLEEISSRRDKKELELRSGNISRTHLSEYSTLNSLLDEEKRDVELFLELYGRGVGDDELFCLISDKVNLLLENQRLDILGTYLNKIGDRFCSSAAELEGEVHFPGKHSSDREIEHHTKKVKEHGLATFEIALGCGKTEQADFVMERVFTVLQDLETLKIFLSIAQKFGAKEQQIRLLEIAGELFPENYACLSRSLS
ncbi:MAG: hypothetical protein AB7W16_19615 [Candidatus Obscuribacterales bacterium]